MADLEYKNQDSKVRLQASHAVVSSDVAHLFES